MENTDHGDDLIHEEREASPISDEEIHEEREASPISEENPEVGMMFDNLDIAYRYYNDYARRVGFSVRKQRTNRNRYNSSIIDIQVLVCSCEGTYKKVLTPVKKRENKRFGCKAEFYVKYTDGRYKLIRFTAEHTHELAPPDQAHYLASHRKIQHFQAELMKKMHASGIRTSDMFSYFAEEAGGEHCLNFIRYDCYNLVQKLRNEFLRNGDVRCLQAWLREKRQENKHFFYSFLTNDAGQVRGVFFSDAKSRRDYSLFGDVLCRGGRKQGGGGRGGRGGRGRKYQPKKITTPQVLDIDEPCRFPERLNDIHPNVRDFIESYEDVKDDGYSEFRAIGEQLGFNTDDGWNDVRRAILEEMRTYANEYTCFFSNEEEFKSCEISLQSEEPIAREDGWIKHPAIGVMVACAFHCVFIIVKSGPLSDGSITYLPLRQPPNSLDNKIVVICNVDENKHYLKLKFMDDAPFPPIVACWRQSKYQEAARWEDLYKTKFDEWEERVYGFILARNRSARARNFESWR